MKILYRGGHILRVHRQTEHSLLTEKLLRLGHNRVSEQRLGACAMIRQSTKQGISVHRMIRLHNRDYVKLDCWFSGNSPLGSAVFGVVVHVSIVIGG